MNESTASSNGGTKRRSRWLWGGLAIVAGSLLIGATTYAASAHSAHFGPFGMMHGDFTPEDASRHVRKVVSWVLEDVDATAEQKTKVNDIFQNALTDLLPLHEQAHSAHERIAQFMSQAPVDRAGLEKVRATEVALLDTASKRLTQAIEDAADVLTPEQRQKLMQMHHRHHHGDSESDS